MAAARFAEFVASTCLVVGGVVPYITQYRALAGAPTPSHRVDSVRRGRSQPDTLSGGFSHFVCLVLLIANILRIFYWFGARFETPLLLQSFLMIAAQLALLKRCVQAPGVTMSARLRDMEWRDVWNWSTFEDYLVFLLGFTALLAALGIIFSTFTLYVELLGFASLVTESTLAMPQAYRNYRMRSTQGLSSGMVLGWAAGDTFKVVYFSLRRVPAQFLVCAIVQLLVDALIFAQMFYYHSASGTAYTPVNAAASVAEPQFPHGDPGPFGGPLASGNLSTTSRHSRALSDDSAGSLGVPTVL